MSVAATSIFDGVRSPASGGKEADRQAQAVGRNAEADRTLRPRIGRAELILDVRQRDRADRRGDDGLLRLDPLVELEAGRRQFLEQALELRLVAGKIGASRVSGQEAPEVERLAALEAVDAKIDQRLVRPAAEVDRGVSSRRPRLALRPISEMSSFTTVETEPSPPTLVVTVS